MRELDPQSGRQSREVFGSFYLAENEFALGASFIQEVVNAPASYTQVPLSPPYLRGLFNLRGTVIPVIDLKSLLKISGDTASPELQKIAIIELDGSSVGILFDRTGEVFKNNEDEKSDFNTLDPSIVVSGVFKKDSGNRVIQILDVTKLFKLQSVPKDSSRDRLRDTLRKKRGTRRQCISFRAGPAKCAFAISAIQEILKTERVNKSALAVGPCIGAIDLRGSTVPVIDFSAILRYREVDLSAHATAGERRIIVMRLEQSLFGLLVDQVDSIISYFTDELVTFPVVQQERGEMFLGCITNEGEPDTLLLNHEKVLSHSEVAQIAQSHTKLYQHGVAAVEKQNAKKAARQTYITFLLDGAHAVPINEVEEIIDFPKHLMQPPGLIPHACGVLNLRGSLAVIIKARSLYSKKAFEGAHDSQKILLFNKRGLHFGLVVDSVESIISHSDEDKLQLPDIFCARVDGKMSQDLTEALQVADESGTKRSMLILNVDSVAERASQATAA